MVQLGGQAVIEGVMIRSPRFLTVSIRKGKKIKTKSERFVSLTAKNKLLGKAFLRGPVVFIEMLFAGMKALNYSAEESGQEEKMTKKEVIFVMSLALVIGIGLFKLLPYGLTYLTGTSEQETPFLFNLIDGVIKAAIFLAYILLISRMAEIKRLFEYHGAEHMAVHCHESGKKLTLANARLFSPVHKRCGTSFIMAVIITGILLFSIIPLLLKALYPGFFMLAPALRYPVLFSLRIVGMLPVMSLTYELIKFTARHEEGLLSRAVSFPGALMQRLTTRTPSDDQLEVAIAAVNKALAEERSAAKEA
jgi:uncharacterized protein YqhQ